MSKDITQETIDQYLRKQLSGKALSDFEQKLERDADLKKEVDTQAFLARGASKFGEDEMRAKLKKIRAEVLTTSADTEQPEEAKVLTMDRSKKSNSFLRWSIAAAVLLALGAVLFFNMPKSYSSSDLYASYYEPYKEDFSSRGGTNETMISQASQLYAKKDFQRALPLFNGALALEPNNAELKLATGVCYLELGTYDKAIEVFSSIKNQLFVDEAQWYLAMTYLKKDDLINAKAVLKKIETDNRNYDKAQDLLEKI